MRIQGISRAITAAFALCIASSAFAADDGTWSVKKSSGEVWMATSGVQQAVLKPGDRVLGLDLSMGGHLTHGSPVNFSGKLYEAHFYGVTKEEGIIDYVNLEQKAKELRPKLIICGASAYSRDWDYERIRKVADEIDAFVMADIAHPAGLIAKGLLNSPFTHCHFVTSRHCVDREVASF